MSNPTKYTVPWTGTFAVKTNKAAGWLGTAAAVGVADGIRILRPGVLAEPARTYEDTDELRGSLGPVSPTISTLEPDMSFQTYGRFESAWLRLLAHHYGLDTAATSSGGNEEHLLLYDTVEDKVVTFAGRYEPIGLFEMANALIGAYTLNWTAPTKPVFDFTLVGDEVFTEGDGGITNTDTEMDAVTLVATGGLVLGSQVAVWVNLQSGDALASSDAVGVRGITHTSDRQLTDTDPTSVTGSNRLHPVPGGHGWTSNLSLDIADLIAWTYAAGHKSGVVYKAAVRFVGATIGTTAETYLIQINFPELTITGWSPNMGDRIGQGPEFVAGVADSTPTGMDYTSPYIQIINTASGALV